jgi:3'(2'), 5'-bisphosphate nucleotidase
MWEKELEIAKEAAVEAGSAIMRVYGQTGDLQIEYKDDHSPLTMADKESNRVIVEKLHGEFPEYAVLSEEEPESSARLRNDYCFVVDPLDGTKEFIKRNGQFTVNIALSYCHKSVMGVIYVPVTGDLYYAAEGAGAFQRRSDGSVVRLSVSEQADIRNLKVVVSNSHGCPEMDEMIRTYHWTNLVKVGSSLKGCMVASGQADVYFRFNPTMEWDTAAMQCIVEEAGGLFRQMDDTPMCYNRENHLNAKGFYAVNRWENVEIKDTIVVNKTVDS